MATYTVYVPAEVGGLGRRADRTIFIREGFSPAAFVFGPLYLLCRRLWLAALGWVVVAALLAALAKVVNLPAPQQAMLFCLLGLLTGFEATVLRQAGLRRRGYYFAALLTSPSLEQAERAFFNGEGIREVPMRRPVSWPSAERALPGGLPEVIGSFPQTGDA